MQERRQRVRARQWRITITEGPDPAVYRVALSWRAFPCRAIEWAGHRYTELFWVGPPISSPEDVEAVLALAVECDWTSNLRDAPERRRVVD